MKRQLCLSAALAAAVGLAMPASANVIYSDTFERTTGSGDGNGDPNGADPNFSDWGANDNGLGGTVSQAWVAGPSRGGGGRNAVTNGSQGVSHGTSSLFEFDAAAAAPNGFQVDLDFGRFVDPPSPGPGGGGYLAFGLGVDAGTVPNDFTAIGASDWSVLFQQAANGNAANAEVYEDNVGIGSFDYLTPDAPHTLGLTVTPAVAGAYGATDTVNIDILVDGTISQSYSVLGGADFGTFAVSANNFDTRFVDNLVVTAIPEPATALLGGLAFLGLALRRSRD